MGRRLANLDWERIGHDLDCRGYATMGQILTARECHDLRALYSQPDRFRRRVVMASHGFGSGEYQYFARPLPALVAGLRRAAYPHLAVVANRWLMQLKQAPAYPDTLEAFLADCRAAGQERPTPLLLKYGAEDHNRLHQDLYGELFFPLQIAVLLSQPAEDFVGGEFMLVEQRPRQQSRGEVIPLAVGEAVIFAVNTRPVEGTRGYYRAKMRHGVSTVRSGERFCLGVIFHDAL